jgi:hypothetical protein
VILLWTAIVASMTGSVIWSYVGRASRWFIPAEAAFGAIAGLLWAILAVSTPSNRTLFVYSLIWDVLYCVVLVAVPAVFLGVRVPLLAWLCIAGAVAFMIGAKCAMGEGQP